MTERHAITIYFTDGNKLSFDFPQQVADETARLTRLQKLLDRPFLVIECDGAVMVFPMQNIKYIQAYPAPSKLPDFAITGAAAYDH